MTVLSWLLAIATIPLVVDVPVPQRLTDAVTPMLDYMTDGITAVWDGITYVLRWPR